VAFFGELRGFPSRSTENDSSPRKMAIIRQRNGEVWDLREGGRHARAEENVNSLF
jgi:hypothetical protein